MAIKFPLFLDWFIEYRVKNNSKLTCGINSPVRLTEYNIIGFGFRRRTGSLRWRFINTIKKRNGKIRIQKNHRKITFLLQIYLSQLPELSSSGEIGCKSSVNSHGFSDFAAMFVAA